MSDLIWVAIIAATPPTIAAFVTARGTNQRVAQVHDLANNRLTEALNKIEILSGTVARLESEARTTKEG